MALNKVNYIDGQTLITAKNMNDIQDEVIRLGEKEAVQSDWSQNDETALDFIKNRTHWSNRQEGEFFNELFENNDGTWTFMAMGATLPILNCDEKYQVIIENQVFESNLKLFEELMEQESGVITAYILGDYSLVSPDIDSTGDPFVLVLIEAVENDINGVVGMLMLLDDIPREADGYRVKISGQFNSVTRLDEIYMPASYNAAKSTLLNLINQMDEAQSNISTNSDSILNIRTQLSRTLKYTSQNLTEAQKAQARKNIGAIGIEEGMQADLSETDESSLAFVKGMLRRDQIPSYIPTLPEKVIYTTDNKVKCFCEQWMAITMSDKPAMGSLLQSENIDQLKTMDSQSLCIQFDYDDGYYYPLYFSSDIDGNYWINENKTIMLVELAGTYMMIVFGEEQPSFSSITLAEIDWSHIRQKYELHPALLPYDAVRRSELDKLNLITLEDIDMICAKTAKVTFPQHNISVKISYTDSKGVFHENEDLPGKSKTTYEVIKDTPIIVNGNYFNYSTFMLPMDTKYYTKISDSEIIPHRDFEIKYADGAPA